MDSPSPVPDAAVMVAALLGVAGVEVPADDLAAIAEVYPALQARMARLHAVDCGDA